MERTDGKRSSPSPIGKFLNRLNRSTNDLSESPTSSCQNSRCNSPEQQRFSMNDNRSSLVEMDGIRKHLSAFKTVNNDMDKYVENSMTIDCTPDAITEIIDQVKFDVTPRAGCEHIVDAIKSGMTTHIIDQENINTQCTEKGHTVLQCAVDYAYTVHLTMEQIPMVRKDIDCHQIMCRNKVITQMMHDFVWKLMSISGAKLPTTTEFDKKIVCMITDMFGRQFLKKLSKQINK